MRGFGEMFSPRLYLRLLPVERLRRLKSESSRGQYPCQLEVGIVMASDTPF